MKVEKEKYIGDIRIIQIKNKNIRVYYKDKLKGVIKKDEQEDKSYFTRRLKSIFEEIEHEKRNHYEDVDDLIASIESDGAERTAWQYVIDIEDTFDNIDTKLARNNIEVIDKKYEYDEYDSLFEEKLDREAWNKQRKKGEVADCLFFEEVEGVDGKVMLYNNFLIKAKKRYYSFTTEIEVIVINLKTREVFCYNRKDVDRIHYLEAEEILKDIENLQPKKAKSDLLWEEELERYLDDPHYLFVRGIDNIVYDAFK